MSQTGRIIKEIERPKLEVKWTKAAYSLLYRDLRHVVTPFQPMLVRFQDQIIERGLDHPQEIFLVLADQLFSRGNKSNLLSRMLETGFNHFCGHNGRNIVADE